MENQLLLQGLWLLGKSLTTCPTHPLFPCVSPQQALREAEEDLRATQAVLDEAKQRLKEVEDGIAMLQAKYEACKANKEELEMKCEQCLQRLARADVVRDRAGFCLLI